MGHGNLMRRRDGLLKMSRSGTHMRQACAVTSPVGAAPAVHVYVLRCPGELLGGPASSRRHHLGEEVITPVGRGSSGL